MDKQIIMTEICLASDHIHQKFHFSTPFDKWLYPSICFMMRSLVLGMIGMFQWNVFVLFLNDQFFYIVKAIPMTAGVIVRITARHGHKHDGSHCEQDRKKHELQNL